MPLSHYAAQDDLARFLRQRYANKPVVVTEMALAGSYGDQGRIDVAAMWSTSRYRKHLVYGYEVKVTRADFLADLRAEKWRRYLSQVDRLFFAVTEGVAQPEEVPPEAGLLVRVENEGAGWRQLRKAPQQVRTADPALPWRLAFRLDRTLRETDSQLRWVRERVRELERDRRPTPPEDGSPVPP